MKRNTTEKAFTLIELLAVIVILAIIALIAVPVILNIIDKANKSAFKDSAYGVLNAAEYYYAASQLELEGPMETVEMETTDQRLELKGSVPTGKVIITRDGEISLMVKNERYCVTKGFEDKDVTITEEPENCEIPSGEGNQGGTGEKTLTDLMVSTTNNCVTSGQCTPEQISTDEGIKVTINVKENTPKDFYVLADDGNKITLIMSENLGDNVEWYADGKDNIYGPTTALAALEDRTKDWIIPEFTYQLKGLGETGTTQTYEDREVTGKARLITYAEANAVGCTTSSGSCPNWMYTNLKGTGDNSTFGYWTSTVTNNLIASAWSVDFMGYLYNYLVLDNNDGVRPVIELSK